MGIAPRIRPCTKCDNGKPVPIAYSFGVMGANPVFLCVRHNNERKATVRPPKPLKSNRSKPTGELVLFQTIWNTRPRVSFISGKKLGEFDVCYFAHVLSKKQYPKLRLTDRNIILLTREEHNLYDNGTIEQRNKYPGDWNKLYELKEKLIYETAQQNNAGTQDQDAENGGSPM